MIAVVGSSVKMPWIVYVPLGRVAEREREREQRCVCVCVREREREQKEGVCVVCVGVHMRACMVVCGCNIIVVCMWLCSSSSNVCG